MLLNCQTNQCDTLDGPVVRGMNGYPHVTFMSYDRYSKQLYRITEAQSSLNQRLPGKIEPTESFRERALSSRKGFVDSGLISLLSCVCNFSSTC